VLWQQFGIRPMDIDRLTLTEAMSVEHAVIEWAKSQR
jgi:hypothetical protein